MFGSYFSQAAATPTSQNESLSFTESLQRDLLMARYGIRMLKRQLERVLPGESQDIDLDYDFKWNDIEEMVMEFDGESCKPEIWTSHVRALISKYRLEEEEAKSLVYRKLKGKAHSWYYSQPNYDSMTCEEILSGLCLKFK